MIKLPAKKVKKIKMEKRYTLKISKAISCIVLFEFISLSFAVL